MGAAGGGGAADAETGIMWRDPLAGLGATRSANCTLCASNRSEMSGSAALRHVCEGGGERRKQQGVSVSVRETSSNSQEENTPPPTPQPAHLCPELTSTVPGCSTRQYPDESLTMTENLVTEDRNICWNLLGHDLRRGRSSAQTFLHSRINGEHQGRTTRRRV